VAWCRRYRPPVRGRTGYVVAALVLASGVGLAVLVLFQQLAGMSDRLQQVVVPGEHQIALAKTGAYTIFHEQRAVVGGRYFASDRHLNGLRLRLQSIPASEDISISPASSRTSYSFVDREGSSIATFDVPRPGTYRLSAWYSEPGQDPTAVLAIGQGIERRLMTAILGSLSAAFVGLLASVAIAVVTYSRRSREPASVRLVVGSTPSFVEREGQGKP
jgi:hypothetical protein